MYTYVLHIRQTELNLTIEWIQVKGEAVFDL